ncbi:dicarboxylate/amino acid:cation symporter [bacterium]|jgi:proton glutamate symport protein|nr:dicarboxylate/amino acid:cation symporter [bacterium]
MTIKLKLHTQIFIGIALGIICGLLLKEMGQPSSIDGVVQGINVSDNLFISMVDSIGKIFVRLLKMIIVPLVLASIVMGIVSLGDTRHVGKIGMQTFVLFVVTTLISVSVGLVFATTLKPGLHAGVSVEQVSETAVASAPSISQILVDIVPSNIFDAMANTSMLSIIFFAVLIGLAITSSGERGRPLLEIFDGLNQVMMKVTDWIMAFAPIGVFALLTGLVAKTGLSAFIPLGVYMGTVLIGLFVHAFVVMPLLLIVLGRYSPIKLARNIVTALATSFSTASSAATLPITMDGLIKNTKVSNRVTSFVIPLGTTINMDGTALFQGVATVFLAQASNVSLGVHEMVIIAVTATLASIGAAAIPSAGIVTLALILDAVGVPIGGISVILTVDRILDMCRTSINLWGNACVSVIVARFQGEELK